MTAYQILSELRAVGIQEKAAHLSRFFKTGPGQYGEGDRLCALLYRLAVSENLWKQRIAIVSTWAFIRRNDFTDTLALAKT